MTQDKDTTLISSLINMRDQLQAEISALRKRVIMVNDLLSELDNSVIPRTATRKARVYAPRMERSQKQIVSEVLSVAGQDGVTWHEVSAKTGIPIRSCSAHLSELKAEGKATHIRPRYFAVLNDTAP